MTGFLQAFDAAGVSWVNIAVAAEKDHSGRAGACHLAMQRERNRSSRAGLQGAQVRELGSGPKGRMRFP
jgi:hypothetical protein